MAIKKIVPKKKAVEEIKEVAEDLKEEIQEEVKEVEKVAKKKVKEVKEKIEEKIEDKDKEGVEKLAEEKKADKKTKAVKTNSKDDDLPKGEEKAKENKKSSVKQRDLKKFEGKVLIGTIKNLDPNLKELGIYSKDLGEIVYMSYEEYGNTNAVLIRANMLLENEIHFNILRVSDEGKIYVSSREYALKRIEELKDKEIDLIYLFRLRYGALFKVKNEPLVGFLANNKYSDIPHLRIELVLRKGDEIKAILDYIGEDGKIGFNAETIKDNPIPVKKYKREDFTEGKIFAGKISGITEKGIFVNLDFNLDALAYTTNYMSDIPLYEGKEVLFKVENIIDDEDGTFRVRGRVTGELD